MINEKKTKYVYSNNNNTKTIEVHSKEYVAIRTYAESHWPSWKVANYNENIAISSHAKKVKN